MLMATRLAFRHPYTRAQTVITAPVPDEVGPVFERFGWSVDGP
jgi:hypothetical protein